MQTTTRISLGLLMAGLVGCMSGADSATKVGDLGRGRFKYACVSDFGDDAACSAGSKETFDFPSSIAVGGSFKLSYEPQGDTVQQLGNPIIKPAANDFLSDDAPGLFLAKKAGRVAVVARSSSNGKAADFTYLRIADPTDLKLRNVDGAGTAPSITMHVNDPLKLRAEAYSGSGTAKDVLAGTIEFVWTSSSEATVKLMTASPASRMELKALAAGTSIIQAKLGDKVVSVDITVTP